MIAGQKADVQLGNHKRYRLSHCGLVPFGGEVLEVLYSSGASMLIHLAALKTVYFNLEIVHSAIVNLTYNMIVG